MREKPHCAVDHLVAVVRRIRGIHGADLTQEKCSVIVIIYQTLHLALFVARLVAGIDKFLHLLVNWDMYLAPWVARLSPVRGHDLMVLVGVIEVIAELIVAFRPRLGAWSYSHGCGPSSSICFLSQGSMILLYGISGYL
jgi:hypothetical protein